MTERIGMRASVDLKVVILEVGYPEYRRYHVLQFELWRPWSYQAKRSEPNKQATHAHFAQARPIFDRDASRECFDHCGRWHRTCRKSDRAL
jgi:hypothetical protein